MSKSFDRVVDAFHDAGLIVKHSGPGKADAQAPGHSNADRSVSIKSIEGSVLVWCHSDPTDQVLATIGLTNKDLFDDPKGMTYTYPDGRMVRRTPQKKFWQEGNTQGTSLYRADRIATADIIAFVEGEKDVHALESVGVVATSTAGGVRKSHLFDLTPLYGKTVRIIRDMDDEGLVHAQQVAKALEGKATVEVYEPLEGKDPADHIASGHTVSEFVRVELPDLVESVEQVDSEFEDHVSAELRYLQVRAEARRRDAAETAARMGEPLHPKTLGDILNIEAEYDWLVPGLFERRDRLIVTGVEGGGKSFLLRQLSIMMAAGAHPFGARIFFDPVKVLVVDAENTEQQWSRAAKYVTEVAERRGAGKPRDNVIVSAGSRLDLTHPAGVNEAHRLIDKYKPDVLYIGPLYKMASKEISTDDEAAPLLLALDSFREKNVTLLMEAHAGHGRGGGGERDLRPRGSSSLMGWPETGFGLRPVDGDASMVALVKWRGDRDHREWPRHLRRGVAGELPWEPTEVF